MIQVHNVITNTSKTKHHAKAHETQNKLFFQCDELMSISFVLTVENNG